MESVRTLIVGAGASGLGVANWLQNSKTADYLMLDKDASIGGYCKTIQQDGFVWDYSGHFLHLRDPQIQEFFKNRADPSLLVPVSKKTAIAYSNRFVDYPFQKNIHQLPFREFLECSAGLLSRPRISKPSQLEEELLGKVGKPIVEKFLKPYNEKLLSTEIKRLSPEALGRFFPSMKSTDILTQWISAKNTSYNDHFLHPRNGIRYYIDALAKEIPSTQIMLNQRLESVDLENRIATTAAGKKFRYEHLVSSTPPPFLLKVCQIPFDPSIFSWSKVLVFNFGFDRNSTIDHHWIYYPGADSRFYRVGFYNNIFTENRLSLYAEVSFPQNAQVDVSLERARVLDGLRHHGILNKQIQLLSEHHILMDPAYVHIRTDTESAKATFHKELRSHGVYSIGRYGDWKYCSIEDNLIEGRELVHQLSQMHSSKSLENSKSKNERTGRPSLPNP